MKIRFLPLLLAAVMALLCGCGQDAEAAGFSGDDLYLVVAETRYSLNTDMEEVLAELGEDYEYSEGKSCDYDGLDKTYLYQMVEFYTWPIEQSDRINEIYTRDPSVTTSRGLSVGATRDEVLSAYGTQCEDTGYQLIYRISDAGNSPNGEALCFDLEGDKVTAIYLTAQTV